nr:Uvs053 [uncultured bacterium]
MHINQRLWRWNPTAMPLGARRTFRFGGVVALALLLAYGLGTPLPFIAPIFAILLSAAPTPPMPAKGALGLLLVTLLTLSIGLLLVPLLQNYPLSAVLLIVIGIYMSTLVTVGQGKVLLGTFLTVGFTMIPAAGLVSHALAEAMIGALVIGIGLAVISQWIVYPLFPENPHAPTPPAPPTVDPAQAKWQALRATLIVMPPVLMAFSNPALYMPAILKTVLLGQQGSVVSARAAGRELLGSTLLAGWFAILLWFGLKIWPNLWMFFLWMLLIGIYTGSKLYGISATRFAPSFWINMLVTLLILLGPAVEDSANGKDVYKAFAMRFGLFVAITFYAWLSILALEWLRKRPA